MIITTQRTQYIFLTGIVLWLFWIVLLWGPGKQFYSTQRLIVSDDFVRYYLAGETLQKGRADKLYDGSYQQTRRSEILGDSKNQLFYYIHTPPFFGKILQLFARFSFYRSAFLWMLFQFACLAAGLLLLDRRNLALNLAFAFSTYPVFTGLTFGQISLPALALCAAVYFLWQREKNFSAGAVFGLLAYKPQLFLGILTLWLAEKNWKALAGAAVTTCALIGFSFVYQHEALVEYFRVIAQELPQELKHSSFPFAAAASMDVFWNQLLGFNAVAVAAIIATKTATLICFFAVWPRIKDNKPAAYGLAVLLSLCLSPYVMLYDGSVLLIAGILLKGSLREDDWKMLVAVLWVLFFVNPAVYEAQKHVPWHFMINPAGFGVLWAFFYVWEKLIFSKSAEKTLPE